MGFEPTTSTLARLRSTPELRPQYKNIWLNKRHSYVIVNKQLIGISELITLQFLLDQVQLIKSRKVL